MIPRQIHIVDGDPAAALITQRGLQRLLKEDFVVTIDRTPNAAWMACASSKVDLLIVDPGRFSSNVLRLLHVVRAFRRSIPILILASYDTPGLRALIRRLGIEHYVAKPVELPELLSRVSDALATTLSPAAMRSSPDSLSGRGLTIEPHLQGSWS